MTVFRRTIKWDFCSRLSVPSVILTVLFCTSFSAVFAESILICSNVEALSKDKLSMARQNFTHKDHQTSINPDSGNESYTRALVLLGSREFEEVAECLAKFGISSREAKKILHNHWKLLSMPSQFGLTKRTDIGKLYTQEDKKIFVQASSDNLLVSFATIVTLASGATPNDCLLRQECIFFLEELLRD